MKSKLLKKTIEDEEGSFLNRPSFMIDEDLEADAIGLEEWAFMQGYYGDD